MAYLLQADRVRCCSNSSFSTSRLRVPSLHFFTALTIFVLNTQAVCFQRSGTWIHYIISFCVKSHLGYSYTQRYSLHMVVILDNNLSLWSSKEVSLFRSALHRPALPITSKKRALKNSWREYEFRYFKPYYAFRANTGSVKSDGYVYKQQLDKGIVNFKINVVYTLLHN